MTAAGGGPALRRRAWAEVQGLHALLPSRRFEVVGEHASVVVAAAFAAMSAPSEAAAATVAKPSHNGLAPQGAPHHRWWGGSDVRWYVM